MNEKDECLFSFAKINKYYLFPFLAPILCCTANYFIHSINRENKSMETHFFLLFFIDLSYLLGGLLSFISILRSKTNATRNNAVASRASSVSKVKYIFYDGSKKSKLKIVLFLILISSLITITSICNLYSMERTVFEKRLYYIFFIAFFSK